MYTPRAELKAGVVVLLAIVGLLALVYYAGGAEPIWRQWRYVELRFQQGFLAPKVGDQAYMNGVAIGRVSDVAQREEIRQDGQLTTRDRLRLGLGPQESGVAREIYVIAVVKMPAEQLIPWGTEVEISESLTGMRRLSFLPGLEPRNLTDSDTHQHPIPAREAPGLGSLSQNVASLLEKIEGLVEGGGEVMVEARGLLRDARDKLAAFDTQEMNVGAIAAIQGVRETLDEVRARLSAIGENLEAASLDVRNLAGRGRVGIENMAADLEAAAANARVITERVDRIVADAEGKLERFFTSIEGAGRDLATLAEDLGKLPPRADRILISAGLDIETLLQTLKDTAHNLQDASEDIRAHPWKLLNEPKAGEIAFENLRLASLTYMRAMRELNQASGQLVRLLGREDLDEETLAPLVKEAVAAFRASQDRYRSAEERFFQLLQKAPR